MIKFNKTSLIPIIALLLFNNSILRSQEKINLSAGFGIPELMNVGVLYQLKQVQIGVGGGFMMHNMSNYYSNNNENAFSVSGEIYYHFAGKNKYAIRKPWYVKAGLNFIRFNEVNQSQNANYLNFRIGHDFNVSEKVGIDIGAGAAYQLNYKSFDNQLLGDWFNINLNSAVVPSIGMRLFLRS